MMTIVFNGRQHDEVFRRVKIVSLSFMKFAKDELE